MAVVAGVVTTVGADNNPQKAAAGVAKTAAMVVWGEQRQQWPSPMLCSTCAKNREREGGCCVPCVLKILYDCSNIP